MSDGLKDCPFCGGGAVVTGDMSVHCGATCEACGATIDATSVTDVVHKWNRRIAPSPEVVKELVEALRENARILGYLSNELQGIVEAGKLAALFNCADRARAVLAKLEGGE